MLGKYVVFLCENMNAFLKITFGFEYFCSYMGATSFGVVLFTVNYIYNFPSFATAGNERFRHVVRN